jgi:hypothetical protein
MPAAFGLKKIALLVHHRDNAICDIWAKLSIAKHEFTWILLM